MYIFIYSAIVCKRRRNNKKKKELSGQMKEDNFIRRTGNKMKHFIKKGRTQKRT
jgi:hypothetical protein